jgi:uncharacterized protein YdhG (YjbR/CyaY superfamily)
MVTRSLAVDAYLENLPAGRKDVLSPVLDVIRANLPEGYEEVIEWGMPTWQVPLEIYPDTYNGKAFLFAGLASRKGHCALYLSAMAGFPDVERRFVESVAASGKPLDMGSSCVRFKAVADLDLPSVAAAIRAMPMADCVAREKALRAAKK